MKGLGEGGVMAPPPAIAAAVEDALRPLGIRIDNTPLSAPRLRLLIERASDRRKQGGLAPSELQNTRRRPLESP